MFPISCLQLKIRLLDDDAPAGYWGSRLRGGYGAVLKEHLCDHRELDDCRVCPRFGQCEYPNLFEPVRTPEAAKEAEAPLKNQTSLPRPFVIDLPRHFSAQQLQTKRLHFGFTLMGALCQRIEYPVTAFSIFGQRGIVAGDGSKRARFVVEDVLDNLNGGRSVFAESAANAMFKPATVRNVTEVAGEQRWDHPPPELEVRFVTPTRIERGQITDFYELVYQLANRVGGLWQLHGQDWPGQAEFFRWRNELLKAAREVKTVSNELREFQTSRYSNRQQKKLPFYGFIGAMRFAGNFAPFEQLLRVGEIVHIGQQTGFGFGQIRIGAEPPHSLPT